MSKGRTALFGAHWSFTAGLAVILIIAVALTFFDVRVYSDSGLALLDVTLQAQAEAVIAIVAVIGGSYAALRFLTPGAKEP